MRRPAWLAIPLALAACSPKSETQAPATQPEPSTSWITYVCEDGRTLQAIYPDSDTARLRVGGNEHGLKIAVSASGARYVGGGWQWWTKGPEGMLAPLKDGETIAAAPGVSCYEPGKGPVQPPAPGTPGGLPDDKTPLAEGGPVDPRGGQAAATVVETYYALIESGRTAEAAKLRRDGLQEDLKPYASLHAQIGAPGTVEGAAGSSYVEVPVVLYGRLNSGGEYHASGKATLRRVNDVPGATAEQLKWRIEKIEVAVSG
jgi:membrane-bound inhibitor of C-type lysozyme